MTNWGKIASRGNVIDRRGFAPVAGGLSITGVALLFVVNYLSGGSLEDAVTKTGNQVIQNNGQQQQATDSGKFAGEDPYETFASTVLGSNNDAWRAVFASEGLQYTEPTLVLFRQATQSNCGSATSEVGPHYCPADQTIYLDETFFDELTSRFGAQGGDVAQAYVIAHEVGHHIQNIRGTLGQTASGTNAESVKTELQADCFAGIWANSIRDQGVFESGEIKEAMDAAAAVGDDRIQERVQGYTNPESFTHGTSEQRVQWFTTGYNSGSINSCDTFR